MGLDQYLFRTTKRRIAAKDKYDALAREFRVRVSRLLEEPKWKAVMDSLPKTGGCSIYFGGFSPAHKRQWAKVVSACRKVAKQVGIDIGRGGTAPVFIPSSWGLTDEDGIEAIAYWRKNWELHRYIIDNFWPDKENDNLIEVYLTKEQLEKTVADGHSEGFKEALERWDDDHVVFYHPWY